ELEAATVVRQGREILAKATLTVHPGEHWALLGPNGAGKSTLLSLAGATVHPSSGTVRVLGQRIGRVELQALRRTIGHVNPRHRLDQPRTLTEVVLTGITGTEDLPMRWRPEAAQVEFARDLLATVGLGALADHRWPTLSQGERGRTLIARALAADPRLLLLDEPATGLDVAAREQLLETIDGLAATRPELASVLVTHHLEELPVTTSHAMLLAHGRTVASGPAAETITTELVSRAFAHPIRVDSQDG
ncbi:ABC transporter ATP-binding protein, partial [Leucobacter sp. M11]|uniref:ABC transporter ATP-binding protein n=1 Tax=Leucobacter sp. M11 TaxID=2993565 RepID=UPI002D7E24EE